MHPDEYLGFLDSSQPVANLQGNLPHWRQEGVTYFVTFRLADSIPQDKLEQWEKEREEWLKLHPPPHDSKTNNEYHRRFTSRIHRWLDAGHGVCVLQQPAVRLIVANALMYFTGSRYYLREWVIMPNHVHVVVTPMAGEELSDILHSWKSYTAKEINKLINNTGTVWQKETFDHIVRHAAQLECIEEYIHHNPDGLPAGTYTLHCKH